MEENAVFPKIMRKGTLHRTSVPWNTLGNAGQGNGHLYQSTNQESPIEATGSSFPELAALCLTSKEEVESDLRDTL